MLQLLHMLDKWTEYLESGGQIDAVYTDFEKAFDKVPHKRLLSKLHSCEISDSMINWMKDFLAARKYSQWQLFIMGRSHKWNPTRQCTGFTSFLDIHKRSHRVL